MSEFTDYMAAQEKSDWERWLNRRANMRKAKAEREAAAKEAKVSTQVLARRRQREYDERQALKETASEAVSWTMDSDEPATSTPFAMLLKKEE